MRKHVTFIAAAASLLLLCSASLAANNGRASGSARATPARVVAGCPAPTKIASLQQGDDVSTTSTSFSNIPGTSIRFRTATKACVIVSYSAQAFAPNSNVLFVKALLDGVPSADGDIQLQSETITISNAHQYNFVFSRVPAGVHNLKMQFRSQIAGQVVAINKFDMLVYHN